MELKPKPGSQELQDAHDNPYVHEIVDFLMQEIDQSFFKEILLFLRRNPEQDPATFERKLQKLPPPLQGGRPTPDGTVITSPDIDKFIQTIADMYEQDKKVLGNLRGAIVELLTARLICSRCSNSECCINHGFVDNEDAYESPQIDVAVLSVSARQIEGNSCKINPHRFTIGDRNNLVDLAKHGQKRGFCTHLGAVSFDNSHITLQQLRNLQCETSIKAYGANNIKELRNNPFR